MPENTLNFGPNEVELLGTYGGDMTHALSAWTSTSRDLTDEKKARVGKLLKMLAENGHGTPFEKSSIHFLIKTDIATHIHFLKHRIGVSINGESARYKELLDDVVYQPHDWTTDELLRFADHMRDAYRLYHTQLDEMVARGVPRKRAKESARLYLPYANKIAADVMFNWRSFDHFLKLRYSSHAQDEVRMLARDMLLAVKETGNFDLTLKAHGYIDEVEPDGIVKPFD